MSALPANYNSTYILFISFISALGGYLFGFDFAVIAGALPFLKQQFGLNEYWEGFATASLAIGCIAGCLVAGRVSDTYGRRLALMIAAIIFFFSSLAMAMSSHLTFFIVSRFFAGVGVGMASMLAPLYIAEIAPAHIRGRMVSINQLTIVLGILLTNIFNYLLRNEGAQAWRWMFGLGAVPSLLFFIGVMFLPESPRWLFGKGLTERAEKVLRKIGGAGHMTESMKKMEKSNAGSEPANYKSLLGKAFLPSVLIGIALAVFQQFCGINVVFNFTTTIFESIGFNQEGQLRQTVFVGVINLIFTVVAMWQVDKIGRKPLMLFGAGALAVLYVFSAVLLKANSSFAAWTLLGAIGAYAMSLAPITWVLISEIFPVSVRGAATSVAVIFLWVAYGLLVFTFPVVAHAMGTYTPFYIYAAICVIGFVFVWFKVKETKGKALEDIDAVMSGH